MKQEIFSKKCPECDKIISSLHKEQFEYNYNEHLEAHKRKEVNNDEKKSL